MKSLVIAVLFVACCAGSAFGGWYAAEQYSTKLRAAQTAMSVVSGVQSGLLSHCIPGTAGASPVKPVDVLKDFGKGFGIELKK